MAQRRMFSMQIVDTDAFMDMPLSAQALYFHLGMRADDDGFVSNARRIQRLIGAADDDLKLLALKRFILTFDSGIVVIKHWRMLNTIRGDRYKPTLYQDEKATLFLKPDGAYTDHAADGARALMPPRDAPDTTWQPSGNQMEPQDRLGKDKLGKEKIGKGRKESSSKSTPSTSPGKVQQTKGGSGEKADAFSTFVSELGDDDQDLLAAIKEYEVMRKKIKKPMTERAKELLLMKLSKGFDREEWIAVLNQSIEKCWLSVYPLKDQEPQGKYPQQRHSRSEEAMEALGQLHEMFEEDG